MGLNCAFLLVDFFYLSNKIQESLGIGRVKGALSLKHTVRGTLVGETKGFNSDRIHGFQVGVAAFTLQRSLLRSEGLEKAQMCGMGNQHSGFLSVGTWSFGLYLKGSIQEGFHSGGL
jgi:hypothetical protein